MPLIRIIEEVLKIKNYPKTIMEDHKNENQQYLNGIKTVILARIFFVLLRAISKECSTVGSFVIMMQNE